jgi:hypothetical protein
MCRLSKKGALSHKNNLYSGGFPASGHPRHGGEGTFFELSAHNHRKIEFSSRESNVFNPLLTDTPTPESDDFPEREYATIAQRRGGSG